MKQTLNKYLPKEPVKIDVTNWFYYTNKGIEVIHQVMTKEGLLTKTDHITIPWNKVEQAVEHLNRGRKTLNTNTN